MKKNIKLKKSQQKPTRTEIQFVRVFTYYVDLKLTQKKTEAFYFKVTAVTESKMNVQTGMTVNLQKLDTIAAIVFRKQKIKSGNLYEFLRTTYTNLQKNLARQNILLHSVQFDECRGLSVLMNDIETFTIRTDFAIDDLGTLHSVTSHFNQSNQLTQIKMKNLKANIEEQIIF